MISSKLAQVMNHYYSTTDLPLVSFKPMEMGFCLARYSVDSRWYHTRIKRYSSEITVELVYLDYVVCTAFELLLANSDNNSSWTEKACFKFHEDTLTKSLDRNVAKTLICLRHSRRVSFAEIVQIIDPRLHLNDYIVYNLPK
ncbi:unnamed protein product [Rotaria sp. Silwood1]|nr:unnamed protein product [Rotaria sp. Silwood1]CAF1641911.1 unnamed protein product [Rotaria sp. Silwood1]